MARSSHPERVPFRRTQIVIAGGLLSWALTLAIWLTVDLATGSRPARLLPHIPRLALDVGRWMFVPGCLIAVSSLRQAPRRHSLREVLLTALGAAAFIGSGTGALYALSIGPLHPKAWALATGLPTVPLVPVACAISWYLWRSLGSTSGLSPGPGAAEPGVEPARPSARGLTP
jgi:hypothetical protein